MKPHLKLALNTARISASIAKEAERQRAEAEQERKRQLANGTASIIAGIHRDVDEILSETPGVEFTLGRIELSGSYGDSRHFEFTVRTAYTYTQPMRMTVSAWVDHDEICAALTVGGCQTVSGLVGRDKVHDKIAEHIARTVGTLLG